MAIQEITTNLSKTLAGLPLGERALLGGLVERMRDLRDEDLSVGERGVRTRRPEQRLAPIETDYQRGPETEDIAPSETEDKPEEEPKVGWETEE